MPIAINKHKLRILGRKYAIRDQDKFYFVTFTIVYWLDVFIRNEYKSKFIDSVKYC